MLRLWREPGAAEGEIGWRGLLRGLEGSEAPVREFPFHGLAGLLAAPTVTFPGGVAGGNVTLSWTHDALYTGYQVWYSTQPYFTPGDDCNAPPAGMSCTFVPAPEHTFTHTGAAADVVNNYTYLVLGVAGSGSRSSPSGRAGEFGFGLTPGMP